MQSPQNEEGSVTVPVDRRAIQLRIGAIFFFFFDKRGITGKKYLGYE